jgi:hypothetical protein
MSNAQQARQEPLVITPAIRAHLRWPIVELQIQDFWRRFNVN